MERAFGMVVDRPMDQQLLAIGGNFIGALRGAEHRDGNAYDRHGDDDADQGEQTKPRSIQARPVCLPGGLRLPKATQCHLWTCWPGARIRRKNLQMICNLHLTRRQREVSRLWPRSLTIGKL